MRLRLNIAGIVLLVLTTSAIGCQGLCEEPEAVFPTRDVVVAAQWIEQGANIELEMLTLRSVPLDETNSMAYAEPALVVGSMAAVEILEFQIIAPNLLVAE